METLRAGSLCGDYLVLYGQGDYAYLVRIEDRETLLDVYCTIVQLEYLGNNKANLSNGKHNLSNIKCVIADPKMSKFDQIQQCIEEDENGI